MLKFSLKRDIIIKKNTVSGSIRLCLRYLGPYNWTNVNIIETGNIYNTEPIYLKHTVFLFKLNYNI